MLFTLYFTVSGVTSDLMMRCLDSFQKMSLYQIESSSWKIKNKGGILWGGGGGGGCPAPSIVVPASVCFSYCKILCNVAKFSPISPSSHPLGYPISHSLFPCPPQTARHHYSRVPCHPSVLLPVLLLHKNYLLSLFATNSKHGWD